MEAADWVGLGDEQLLEKRISHLDWVELGDEQLLEKRISHLGLKLEGLIAIAILIGAALVPATRALLAQGAKAPPQIELTVLGSYASGIFNAGGSEIAAHDPLTQRLYVVNAQNASVNVLDISDPTSPTLVDGLSLIPFGGVANSVAVHKGLVAVAMEATPNRADPGKVVFFDSAFLLISVVNVGAVPDMLTFTHEGEYVLVANEGEACGQALSQETPGGAVSGAAQFSVERAVEEKVLPEAPRDRKDDPAVRIMCCST